MTSGVLCSLVSSLVNYLEVSSPWQAAFSCLSACNRPQALGVLLSGRSCHPSWEATPPWEATQCQQDALLSVCGVGQCHANWLSSCLLWAPCQ